MPSPLMKTSEVADVLGVTARRVRQLIDEGRLPATRIGPRSIRVPRAAFDAWLEVQVERSVDAMRGDRRRA